MYMASIIIENNKVDKIVYPKNGKARVKQVNNPFNVYPYEPINQTPKFVKIKKPSICSAFLFSIFFSLIFLKKTAMKIVFSNF